MQTLLITGGCGFIGSNFIRYLLEKTSEVGVVNYDALTYAGNLQNLQDLAQSPRYTFVKGDIVDREKVESTLRAHQIHSVINFAAESHVDRSILDSAPFIRSNIVGTQVLLDAARACGVQRFVQISTDEVYGTLGPTGSFSETTPLAPNSPYAASKASADLLVRAAFETFRLPTITTRCSNNYGPFQFPEKLIPLFVSNLANNLAVPVYGDGLQVRDWIHVRDHCAGILAAWQRGRPGEVYNLGGRCEQTNLDLTLTLLQVMNKPRSLIKFVEDRPGHDRRYAIDCSKAERELAWQPSVRFEQGLRDTVAWYQANSEWVKNIRSGDYLRYYEQQYGSRLSA